MSCIHEDDLLEMMASFRQLVTVDAPISKEMRFKKPWTEARTLHGEPEDGTTWVIAAVSPERNEDGVLVRMMGALIDISSQKWAEEYQKRRTQEMREAKRQQSRFIDMTSHEMRNPLSAVYQSADSILQTSKSAKLDADAISSIRESAETIVLVRKSQKQAGNSANKLTTTVRTASETDC